MTNKAKTVVFLGSKPVGYACFETLLARQSELNYRVVGLLTKSRNEFGGADLADLARQTGIPVLSSLEELPSSDIIYSVQYHEILKAHHIARASGIAVNLHMAPLPEYRGSNQFSLAIIEGKREFGVTIHQIDTKIDHGPILFQQRFPIPENCWVEELYNITERTSIELFSSSLSQVIGESFEKIDQKSLVSAYGTSLHLRNEIAKLKEIDLSWEVGKIERHIRATSMSGFEPPYCVVAGKKVYFSLQRAD